MGSNQPISPLKPPPSPSLPQYPPYHYLAEHYRVDPVPRENLYYYPHYSDSASAPVYSQPSTAYSNYYANGQGNHPPPPENGYICYPGGESRIIYPENNRTNRPDDSHMNRSADGQINRQVDSGKLSSAETLLRNTNSCEGGGADSGSDEIFPQPEQPLETKRALSGLDELATVALSYASEG
ncbi:hypothetical protein HK100_007608 [Physocladia obscura]|uniref:Uncharacterized protein n=1 Tax=Physocladia obscura TaxID=109957 RepID=A0AAD5TA98_9FUNG|nr:hypothetical protein HK100_007608 [Physocladia obscura]